MRGEVMAANNPFERYYRALRSFLEAQPFGGSIE
jgi:hypothetical protein